MGASENISVPPRQQYSSDCCDAQEHDPQMPFPIHGGNFPVGVRLALDENDASGPDDQPQQQTNPGGGTIERKLGERRRSLASSELFEGLYAHGLPA
jgi:hypothetical protein